MSLDSFVKITAIPECFERLQADAERMRSDLERLQRFVELSLASRIWPTMAANSSAPAPVSQPSTPEPVEVTNAGFRLQLEDEADQPAEGRMVARFQLMINKADIVADLAPAPAPEPSASAPVEMDAGARQRLEDAAAEAATSMVLGIDLMTRQGQSTATSLAYALRIAREASAGFECSQTMGAILRVLDGMDAAAREEQSNG